jgi:hypothetical protein
MFAIVLRRSLLRWPGMGEAVKVPVIGIGQPWLWSGAGAAHVGINIEFSPLLRRYHNLHDEIKAL